MSLQKPTLDTLEPLIAGSMRGIRWVGLRPRAAVVLSGEDAVKFCDNFVTAAVSKLAVGEGCEAFLTDSKGWVLAFVQILRTSQGVLLDADGDGSLGERLRAHLEHYHIREKVEIVDASHEQAGVVVAGEGSAAWLTERLGIVAPKALLAHASGRLGNLEVRAVRVDWVGEEAFLLLVPAGEREAVGRMMSAAGIPEATAASLETARIEQGFPNADDIPEKTLPQELGRDARAISFTKGCYLGQETVARIDALGHVNRRLTGLAVEGGVPVKGASVTADGEPVGRVSSSCHSSRLGGPLAFGLLHVKAAEAANLAVDGCRARIVPLPLPAPAPRVVLQAKRFRVVSIDEPLADGSTRTREVVEHPGSVVILPLLDHDSRNPKVCLIENHRVAIGRSLLELPAGTLDREEAIEEAAARELSEETGYLARRMTHVGSFWMSPGILRERMHLFRAEELVAGEQALEPGERIVVRLVPWEEAVAMCLDGRIEDAKSIAGILIEQMRRQAETVRE